MLVDILVCILIISAIYRGWNSGFVRQLFGTGGFFGGLFIGGGLLPHIVKLAHTGQTKAALTLTVIIGCTLTGLTVGEIMGVSLKRRLLAKRINYLDNGFGGGLGIVSVLLSVWLIASVTGSLPSNGLKTEVRSSRIIAGLNQLLPPAPNLISKLGHLIVPNGFPDVFIGNEPIPRGNINLPALGDLATAVNQDKDSIVRIKGQGCGGVVAGSGFVVGAEMIATNAHVVAGIKSPYVQDVNGSHAATVVSFDPNLDLAILRTNGLAGRMLNIDTRKSASGTPAVVLGYPGGGDFQAGPAAVLDQITAGGRDIYGQGHTLREVYEVKADVVPGNSGGPLVAKDGNVIGVIFAESTTYNHVGYALTAAQITGEIGQAGNHYQAVSTGSCAE